MGLIGVGRAVSSKPDEPVMRRAAPEDEEERSAPEDIGECSDLEESREAADIPRTRSEERGIIFENVPVSDLFSFLEEDEPKFINYNNKKVLAVLVSKIISPILEPLSDSILAEAEDELLEKASELLAPELQSANISVEESLNEIALFENFESLDFSKQACSIKQHGYKIIFAIKEEDFIFNSELLPSPEEESIENPGELDDPGDFAPEPELINSHPTSNSLVICDYDTFRSKMKTISRFFRFYGLILKNPKKGYFVSGVSYSSHSFRLRNKGKNIRFVDQFKNVLKNHGRRRENPNKNYYIPSFNNNKKITIFFNSNFTSIHAIKFTREEGCEKIEEFLEINKAELERGALTNSNTNWFIKTHERAYPFVANYLFSSASRKKMDPLDAVQKYFLPPGAKLRQKKCYEDFDFKDLPGMMADGFTELALENGARDLFENKPLKAFEDILREQSLLNSPEFNKFRLAVGKKDKDNKMLQDLFVDALGGKSAFKADSEEIREDWRAFWEGFDPKIFAYLAIGTLASQAINGLVDTDTLNAFVAKKLGDLLGDKISFRKILRSVPMPVLMNIIGSAGLFSPSLLAAMNSNVSDMEAVVRDPEGAGSIPLKFQLEEKLRVARQQLSENTERISDLEEDPDRRSDTAVGAAAAIAATGAIRVSQLETSLQNLENNGRRTPEEAFDAIGRDGSKFRKELTLAGFTQSDFNKVIELATENADENLSQIQALLIELVLMAYECGSSGVNKQIGFMISQEIIKFVGLDDILEQFDDFADFLTAWDINNMDFCNPPTWPPPGFDFNFSLNIKFPRFDLGGLLAFIFPLLFMAIIGLIVGLIMMIIRIILSLIPNIPLNLEICEVANYLRDVGVDLSDAICKRMKGTHSFENKLARRTGALAASTFSSKNSVCNLLGLGDEALESNPDKNNEIAGCIEDFCSLLTPNTSFKFMRGNLDESEAKLLLRVLRNSGKDNCKEFAESMENMPNFVQIVNDLGFVIGEAVDIDGFADDMFPFDPEAPIPSLSRPPTPDICDPGAPLTAECYGNISDERLAQIIQNNREAQARLTADAVGILTGGTTFDELFRNNAPPPLHPSEMLDDEGASQASFRNGSAPIVSRDEGPLKGIRRGSFAALFGYISANFDGDIRVLTGNATRFARDLQDPEMRLPDPATNPPEEIPLVVSARDEPWTGFLFQKDGLPESIQIKTSMETFSTEEVRNKIFIRNEVRNNLPAPLGLSFNVDYDLPAYSIPIREWMQENSHANRWVNRRILQAVIENSLSTDTTGFFDTYIDIGFINNSLNFGVGEYSKNIVKIFSEQVNNLIPFSDTSSLEELESFEVNSLRPASTKLCINNPLYSILTLENNYFNGFLSEIKTMERFEKCSTKYSKILSRFRDDEVATLDGALRGNIDTQILNSYFEQFYSLYTFGEVMPSLFNRPTVFSSFIQQRTLNEIGIGNYPKFVLLCQELQRIRGVDLDELRNSPGALEQFIQESRQIAEALVDNVRAVEIIQKREELDFKKYFDNNILSFKKSFKNFFKVNGKVVNTRKIERKENDELFSTITLDNFTNVEYCEQPRHSVTDLVFAPTARSEDINGFIRPFYYPGIKLGNYENNAIFLERFFRITGGSDNLFTDSFIKIGDGLDISSFPADTGDLRYSLLSKLKFKEDFLSSEAETEYFSNIIIEEFTELVEPPETFAARLAKLSAGEKIEIPFEEILTLGSDIDMINSNNFIFKIYNALSDAQRERFDIASRNDILKIIDVELGIKIYLINHSSDITEEAALDINDDQKLFTKAEDSKTSFVKLLWEDAGGLGREFFETQKIIKLLELGESFVSVEEISFPTGDIDTSIASTAVKILPFRLGNMYTNSDVVDSSTESYLEEFYGLNNLIPSLISNSEIEDLLTYAIPVDIILGGLSIYYSDYLKIWEEVLGLNYFRRGFEAYEKINKSFFEVMINTLKRKKIKFSLRDLAEISPIL